MGLQYTCISMWCMRSVLSLEVLCVDRRSCKIVWTNIVQKAEVKIWKQCTALLALMQLLAVPYNRCEQ